MISAVQTDPIVAVSTPSGMGGIAVVRLSGKGADRVIGKCWKGVSLDGILTVRILAKCFWKTAVCWTRLC